MLAPAPTAAEQISQTRPQPAPTANNNVKLVEREHEKYEQSKLIEVKNMPWGIVTFPKAMGSLDQAKLTEAESTPAK